MFVALFGSILAAIRDLGQLPALKQQRAKMCSVRAVIVLLLCLCVCVACERCVTSTSTSMLTEANENCQLTHFADEWCDLERGPSEGGGSN